MRQTTVSKEWKELIDRAAQRSYEEGKGAAGIDYVCGALECAPSTVYRASRGQAVLGEDLQNRLQVLCDLLGVANPYEKTRPWSKDLKPLRLLGQEVEMGLPVHPQVIKRLRKIYPDSQLIRLAESDGTTEQVMRAVLLLLEGA